MTTTNKVFKFGGASLKNAESIRNVADIIRNHRSQKQLVVVSAIGKTTNALEKVVRAHARQDGQAPELMLKVKRFHFQLLQELLGTEAGEAFDQINDLFVEADWILDEPPHPNYDYMYDQLVSLGELVSSRIVAFYLQQDEQAVHWLDARDVILTDDIYREGWVNWPETQKRFQRLVEPLLDTRELILTQGFIASTQENNTTTLGREGSDYSAAILSYCMDAEDMTIWKDVPGVLTADPRLFDDVVKLDRLSYREAIEMTYYGAKVIHPKTIKPLQNKSIPLYVKSFLEPAGSGTFISDEVEDTYPPMVAVEQEQALLQISTRDFSFVAEHHISMLFNLIADLRLQVNMMQNSAISFGVCVNDQDDKVDRFIEQIQGEFKVLVDRGLELITVRHYQSEVLNNLRKGKLILLEERIRKTVQMVVKDVPMISRRSKLPEEEEQELN